MMYLLQELWTFQPAKKLDTDLRETFKFVNYEQTQKELESKRQDSDYNSLS
jgi:hypothetical protein